MTVVRSRVEPTSITFPEGFRWGAATAAYQIEGATRAAGRGRSIWDTFAATPGRVHQGHTGDVACDHYRRYRDDIALLADLGMGTYRFSIAWPRIKPDGSGPTNRAGLDFYDRLVDELCARGVEPMVTLYHWDLPQALEDRGGWTARSTAEAFAEYAATVVDRLGDRVPTWTTLNEPYCSAFLGYGDTHHAPGRGDPQAAFRAVHHLLLGHGLAAQALRAGGANEVSITLNVTHVEAVDPDDPHDLAAARRVDGLSNRLFSDALLRGEYPDDMLPLFERFGALSAIHHGDLATIATPIDLVGLNYYNPSWVRARIGAPASPAFPGTEGVEFVDPGLSTTDMGWPVDASGLTKALLRFAADHPGMPVMITENGAAYSEQVVDGRVSDPDRIAFLDSHLQAAHDAISEGVDLRGYLVWSLLDNFEWAHGYDKRFGIVHVDYRTQQRIPKDSARWFSGVIRANGLPAATEDAAWPAMPGRRHAQPPPPGGHALR
nr:GH1 family beta-glucosidase [Nitriliruptor alkaliphilus]